VRGVLRAGGDQILVTRSSGYQLRVGASELDLVQFERLVEDGRSALRSGAADEAAETLRKALALWRGKPYEDVTSRSSPSRSSGWKSATNTRGETAQPSIEAEPEASLAA
jgi:Bacterial transcriptional activator domain